MSYEDRAKVQIGAELLCKGGKERVEYWIEYRVRITDFKGMRQGRGGDREDYGIQSTEERQVQKCKSEQSSCVKVEK